MISRTSPCRRSFSAALLFFAFLLPLLAALMTSVMHAESATDTLLEKGFSQSWIDGLAAKGEERFYHGEELAFIGMPVGGLFAGQVYLGGDGRLWYWDIFNRGVMNPGGPGDKFYKKPLLPDKVRTVSSGFILELDGRAVPLDARGFAETRFRGEYPIARILLADASLPLRVELEAFSPFCPTATEDSSLPATIMSYRLTNTSDKIVAFRLGGWLENASNREAVRAGTRTPTTAPVPETSALMLSAADAGKADLPHADTGSMAIARLGGKAEFLEPGSLPESWKSALAKLGDKIPAGAGVLRTREMTLPPGESLEVRFAVCWYFPNAQLGTILPKSIHERNKQRHYYSKRYADAGAVAKDLTQRHDELVRVTRLWRDTWYDSTLPVWFLDRSFINTSTLATTACLRLHDVDTASRDGRVYFWEGVYLGAGTCTHVTHYEQAFGRLFPDAARAQRRITDYHIGWDDKLGYVKYRAEWSVGHHFGIPHAIDGHAGTVLRTWREHTSSRDEAFLRSVWPQVKRATRFMIDQDAGRGFFEKHVPEHARNQAPDGILEGPQYNTLDKVWDGIIPWTSGLYISALRATAEMATEMGDASFAKECTRIAGIGGPKLARLTFSKDFGYFVQRPEHPDKYVNSNNGLLLDQLLGDYWAQQANLAPVFPQAERRSALAKMIEYNFFREVADYRSEAMIQCRRHYADDDEPGLVMCSFPHGGEKMAAAGVTDWDNLVIGYFTECMTGFSYPVAAEMLHEGMITDGLAICRAIHERYAGAPLRRNPFNEIEYGNHYTRAMSGYAPFIAICGFSFHGPKGEIGFAPRLRAGDFKAAFTAAEGWGSYSQTRPGKGAAQSHTLQLKWGKLRVKTLISELPAGVVAHKVTARLGQHTLEAPFSQDGGTVTIQLPKELTLTAGQNLEWEIR